MKVKPNSKSSYPNNPGIYKMLDNNGSIIYIGKAKNLQKRLTSYFDKSVKSKKVQIMVQQIHDIELIITNSENDALVLEQKLINKIKPKYNIIFRDDKSYPFIVLSKHDYPKIYITREKRTKNIKDNLFGPYPKKEFAYKNLEFVQKAFKIRTCTDSDFAHRSRPCILHSVGKCSAPCIHKDDSDFKKEYEKNVNEAKNILTGKINISLNNLTKKMESDSQNFNYESAAKIRDTIFHLQELKKNQTIYSLGQENILVFNFIDHHDSIYLGYAKIIDGIAQEFFYQEVKKEFRDFSLNELLTSYIESEIIKNDKMKIITPIKLNNLFYKYKGHNHNKQEKDWLNFVENNLTVIFEEQQEQLLKNNNLSTQLEDVFNFKILNIDFIDISHYQSEATYGAKISWLSKENKLEKNNYRLAKLPDGMINDIENIYQTVDKIYNNENDLPSILIIDGDIPQLNAAYFALKKKNFKKNMILLSSAKGVARQKGKEIIYIHPSSHSFINSEYKKDNVLNLSVDNKLRYLIENLQDTAHNMANYARKRNMSKKRFS